MTGRALLGIVLVLGGSIAGSPPVIVLGLAAVLFEGIRGIWRQRGLEALVYERRLARERAVVGDVVPLDVTVWNRKRLPLAWVTAEDLASPSLVVRERDLVIVDDFGRALANAWTLAPYERVVRHFHLQAARRGVHELGPARVAVGDLFAGRVAETEVARVDRLLVRPRTVPIRGVPQRARWGGSERARRGLLEHPLSYAGVREYQPGDPLRKLHHRASARVGRPLSKRFDPAREREVLLAMDLQTLEGPAWQPIYDDDRVEELCVAIASLARHLRDDGAAVGLAVAGYAGAPRPVAVVPPSEAPGQLPRILDVLARLSPFPSAPFGTLLGALPRTLRPGADVIVLTARDPLTYLPALRRMARLGYGVTLLAIGPEAATSVARARSVGVAARPVALDGSWADCHGLVVA